VTEASFANNAPNRPADEIDELADEPADEAPSSSSGPALTGTSAGSAVTNPGEISTNKPNVGASRTNPGGVIEALGSPLNVSNISTSVASSKRLRKDTACGEGQGPEDRTADI
jgi:hypothetical protein